MFRSKGELFFPEESPALSPDPADTKFLDCALVARADFIVTGNKRDFPVAHLRHHARRERRRADRSHYPRDISHFGAAMAKKANANRKRPRLDERFEFLSDDAKSPGNRMELRAAAFPVYDRVTQTDRALRLWRKTDPSRRGSAGAVAARDASGPQTNPKFAGHAAQLLDPTRSFPAGLGGFWTLIIGAQSRFGTAVFDETGSLGSRTAPFGSRRAAVLGQHPLTSAENR